MSSHQSLAHTENFKKALKTAEQKKGEALFVFDVDSTLFCMKYRTQAIIRDCAKDPVFCQKFPEQVHIVQQVEATERDWSVREILSRYGFSEKDPLTLSLEKIWRNKFFSGEYLHLDRPYKGCVEFIRRISQFGSHVCYLTARSRRQMYEGTLQSLKNWAFPLKDEKHLIMKENSESELSDAEYKIKHLKEMTAQNPCVLFFENEPVILNMANRTLPSLKLFWMNSTHSRREQPTQNALPLSMNYCFS